MIFFAVFTIGYFVGVVSALAIFPPRDREILEQEKDSLGPILDAKEQAETDLGQIEPELNVTLYSSK